MLEPTEPSSVWDAEGYRISVLERVRHHIEEGGRISVDGCHYFFDGGFDPEENELARIIWRACTIDAPSAEPKGPSDILDPDVCTKIIKLTEEEMGRQIEKRTRIEAQKKLEREAKASALAPRLRRWPCPSGQMPTRFSARRPRSKNSFTAPSTSSSDVSASGGGISFLRRSMSRSQPNRFLRNKAKVP